MMTSSRVPSALAASRVRVSRSERRKHIASPDGYRALALHRRLARAESARVREPRFGIAREKERFRRLPAQPRACTSIRVASRRARRDARLLERYRAQWEVYGERIRGGGGGVEDRGAANDDDDDCERRRELDG